MSYKHFVLKPLAVAVVSASFALPALGQSALEEIVVTSQRKAESIQDVPVAISAFGADEMEMRRIDDGRDLQLAVPNLTFTGGNAFQIRGVGNSVGGTTGDVGVGIHHNNAPQVVSRVVSAETYDVERIEVLRGPQGTLYGRNSTGGVINYITAKPVFDETAFSISAELGNYNSRKFKGMANIPLGDKLALRLAGMTLDRDGYTKNDATGNDIDDRDLYSLRATLAFRPTDRIDGWLLLESFREDDSRSAGARSLCITDHGPDYVGSTRITDQEIKDYLSQGCAAGSVYDKNAFGRPNSVAIFGGRFAHRISSEGYTPAGNLYAGQDQPRNLRRTSAFIDPQYTVKQDIVELEVNFHLSDNLTLSFLGHHSEDDSYTKSGSFEGSVGFLDTPLTPGGIWTDYQSGPGRGMRTLSISDAYAEQTSLELRLQSSFDGPFNFNVGVLNYEVERDTHTFVSTNTTTLYLATGKYCQSLGLGLTPDCLYHDPKPKPDYTGHQYFDTWTPYELKSNALFAETYYDISDTLKLTTGIRYTDDDKRRVRMGQLLLNPVGENGIGTPGYPPGSAKIDEVDFQEWTGRIVLDWMPDLAFTDSTLVYGSFSRGYKAGGFNTPESDGTAVPPYKSEFVNAWEIGTKNILAGGRARLNASLFFYDYENYQISKREEFAIRNENIDVKVYGLEIESAYDLLDNLTLFANLGWMKTEIQHGSSVDPLDRTLGDPNFTVLRGYNVGCIAPTAEIEALVNDLQSGAIVVAPGAAHPLFNPCGGRSSGIEKDLTGNELPNAPKLSAALSLQYNFNIADWASALRFDYSWKDKTYTSVFNSINYELDSWDNANASLTMHNYDMGLSLQFFVKNLFDDDTIVNHGPGSEGVGQTRGLTLLDPRIWGLAMTYQF